MTTLLEQEYVEPQRPYSQKELQYNREQLFRNLHIGNVRAHHNRCQHFYFVKENGRKHKEIEETKNSDIGNCSVCWKINKTPYNQKHLAQDLVYHYDKEFSVKNDNITHYRQDLERVFYTWLYEDQNQQRPRRQRVNNNDNNGEAMESVAV